ncbi:response regulator transcription factor [Arsukibacterium sp.]|uniref:response regulator transcription factor n=1 Tax=Arsukibacterium sp. TaxID=1977258 RepID=UPI002FD90E1E
MDRFSKLIILTERSQLHNTAMLAQSVAINVKQASLADYLLAAKVEANTLIGIQFSPSVINRKTLSAELQRLMTLSPVFIFQAERSLIDAEVALRNGIRGLIFRDEQLDRVLMALKALMAGQLYYSRDIMSGLLDTMLFPDTPAEKDYSFSQCSSLTRQEKRIIQLVAKGARNKEIAAALNISAHTVKAHMSAIFRKTNARNRVELLRNLQQPGSGAAHQPLLAKLA